MTAPRSLAIQIHHDAPEATVIQVAGELDLARADQLRSALLSAIQTSPVVLDAADISFCDSAGLRTLAEARHLAQATGHAFRLAAPSPAVTRVLELADATTFFEIHPDVESALKSRAPQPENL